MPYGPEPTPAEQRVIDAMKAKHPTWTARRYLNGWSIDERDVPVLAWHPDIFVAWRAAEQAVAYDPDGDHAG